MCRCACICVACVVLCCVHVVVCLCVCVSQCIGVCVFSGAWVVVCFLVTLHTMETSSCPKVHFTVLVFVCMCVRACLLVDPNKAMARIDFTKFADSDDSDEDADTDEDR